MAPDNLDKEMWLAIPVFTLGAAVSLGLVGGSWFGIDFSQVLIETNGVGFSVARLASLGALALVFANRDTGFRDFSGIEAFAVYATIGLILAPPFIPLVSGTLLETPWAFVAFVMQSLGIAVVSYVN